MATPPTFVGRHVPATNWSGTTTPITNTFTPGSGNILCTVGGDENCATTLSISGGPTWTLQQSNVTVANSDCANYAWTATGAGSSFTLSVARSATSASFGFDCLEFSGSDGVGASNKNRGLTGAHPTLGLTTTQDNSAIVVIVVDFNARDGAARVWDTVNGITPTAGNSLEVDYFRNVSTYAIYAAYWSDVGAAGAKTVGVDNGAATSMQAAIIAVEVKGAAGAAVSLPDVVMAPRIPT